MESDGVCFRFAIKYGNVEMLAILIRYYINAIQEEERSLEYNYKIYKLKQVLIEAEKRVLGDISEEITEMLSQYIAEHRDSKYEEEVYDDDGLCDFSLLKANS